MDLKPNAAEIVAALSPRERWRLHHRYCRQLYNWENEAAIGDPLGLAKELREKGILAYWRHAIALTAPLADPATITEIDGP